MGVSEHGLEDVDSHACVLPEGGQSLSFCTPGI